MQRNQIVKKPKLKKSLKRLEIEREELDVSNFYLYRRNQKLEALLKESEQRNGELEADVNYLESINDELLTDVASLLKENEDLRHRLDKITSPSLSWRIRYGAKAR